MIGDLEHLISQAARLVDAPMATRFAFIERDKVIPTPDFLLSTGRLLELHNHHRILRPPNMALVGPAGIGKSHAIADFVEKRKPLRDRATGDLRVPVLHVQHPPIPGPRWYAKTLAKGLGYAVALPRTYADMFDIILERLEIARTRLIIVEEVNELYGWPHVHMREFYGLTRWLSNRSQIPQVLSGTTEVLDILAGDVQLVRRFERLEMKPFALDETFAGFVAAYLRTIPLRLPSDMDRSFIERVHEAGEGITDTTVKVLQRAAKRAIITGAERVLLEHIEIDSTAVPPVLGRPSARRHRRRTP